MNDQKIEEFKNIFADEFGVELDDQTARGMAENLLRLMDLLYRPIRRDWPMDRGP